VFVFFFVIFKSITIEIVHTMDFAMNDIESLLLSVSIGLITVSRAFVYTGLRDTWRTKDKESGGLAVGLVDGHAAGSISFQVKNVWVHSINSSSRRKTLAVGAPYTFGDS
jgi:hypothetical protein